MWSPLKSLRGGRVKSEAHELVEESECFLAGRYPSVLQAAGCPVPGWAWLSMLAHAPADVLMAEAEGTRRHRRDRSSVLWLGAVALLCQELVMVANRTGSNLEEVQHALIQDVELTWEPPRFEGSIAGPSQFVGDVRGALERYRRIAHPR